MKGRKKRGRFGTLLFALPIVIIVTVVAFQLISETYYSTGTLFIETKSSERFYPAVGLNVSASVGGQGGTTPFTLTLTQGVYTVVFPSVLWYSTPSPEIVTVIAGRTSYGLGVYNPIVKAVSVEGSQFNASSISARHGVTPISLINKMSGYAVIQGTPDGTIILQHAQNYTHVYKLPGTFTLTLFGTGAADLTVSVT
jgi:hypothetical protein